MVKFWTVVMILGLIITAVVMFAATYIWMFMLVPIGLGVVRGILK